MDFDTTQHAHAQKKAKRSGKVDCCGKGGSRVFPDCDFTTRPRAKETKRRDHAGRLGKRLSLDCNSNQRPAEVNNNSVRPAAF